MPPGIRLTGAHATIACPLWLYTSPPEVLFPEETRPSRYGSFIQAKVFDDIGLDVLRCFFDGISQE